MHRSRKVSLDSLLLGGAGRVIPFSITCTFPLEYAEKSLASVGETSIMDLDAFLIGISQRIHLLTRCIGVRSSQCQYLGLISAAERNESSSVLREP